MVTISREAAECAATALRKINEEDYYSNNGKAQREIEMALKSVKYNYDPKCWDLAGHFLSETVCKDTDREELAQDIQDAVESWFGEWERKIASPPAEAPEPCKTCGDVKKADDITRTLRSVADSGCRWSWAAVKAADLIDDLRGQVNNLAARLSTGRASGGE